MNYEVTIGIPVYNAEHYICRAMDSALAQTYENVEFLILDDCGTDSSMEIIREYQKTHPRGKAIRIVTQPYNKGIGEARNRIVEEAQGHFLFYMDADDAIAPNTIELLYNVSQKYNAEVVYGSYWRIEEFGDTVKRIKRQYPLMHFLKENEFAEWAYSDYNNLQAMVWNLLIDVDVYRKNKLYHLPISYLEDFVFTIDLPAYVHRAVLLPDITYYYYCREGSASQYQKRTAIEKHEIESTIGAMKFLKNNSYRIAGKPFFSLRMLKVMKTCYFIATHIVKNEQIIEPRFSDREIRNVMRSPLTIGQMLWPSRHWFSIFCLYILGVLPPSLSVWLIRIGARESYNNI